MIVIIVAVSYAFGTIISVAVGACLSVLCFVYQAYETGCIKYEASGLTWHSSVQRTELSNDYLEEHGDSIQIMQLQGFIFFGNATMLTERTRDLLQSHNAGDEAERDLFEPVKFLILDFALVTGLDASALSAIEDTTKVGKDFAVEVCELRQVNRLPSEFCLKSWCLCRCYFAAPRKT